MVCAQRTQLRILAALVAGSVVIGCGGDSGNGDPPVGTNDSGAGGSMDSGSQPALDTLKVTFSPIMYSAYEPDHPYRLPVLIQNNTGAIKVTTEVADFVDSEPTPDGVMLTMRKAGTTAITFTDGAGNTGRAQLKVTAATAADWETGRVRYTMGPNAFELPDGGIAPPEGGVGMPMLPERNPESACIFCHRAEGSGSIIPDSGIQFDVEHTPQQIGGYSDEEIASIFTSGMKPPGSPWRVLPGFIAPMIYPMIHKWNVAEDVKKGIVVYMRSVAPKAQGPIDFGGLRPPGGMGMRPDAGQTSPTDGGAAADTGTGAADGGSTTADTGTGAADTGTADAGVDAGP